MPMPESPGSPLIDVLIPVRAPAPWFREALQSVVQQTMKGWRLVVVMDGFAEDLQDACDSLPFGTPIHLEVLPASSGLVAALNHGLQSSEAEFIARLDADDVCHPDRLAKQLEYLSRHSECVALGTGVRLINEEGAPIGFGSKAAAGSVLHRLKWRSPIAHPSTMLRRAAVVAAGGYSPAARHAEDFELWLRMAAMGEIHAIPDVLLDYRVHSGQVTSHLRFPRETVGAIRAARCALARARRESIVAAEARQLCWVAVNRAKGR